MTDEKMKDVPEVLQYLIEHMLRKMITIIDDKFSSIPKQKMCPRTVNVGICSGCNGTMEDAKVCTWGRAHPERVDNQ